RKVFDLRPSETPGPTINCLSSEFWLETNPKTEKLTNKDETEEQNKPFSRVSGYTYLEEK
ncbi:hypothetical protein RUM43_003464, partial [Polyplax serrata]